MPLHRPIVGGATVTVAGLDAATKAAALTPVKSSDKGVAMVQGLAPGRYAIEAEFPGFAIGLLKDVQIRSGDNKHVGARPLKRLQEAVTVGRDPQAAAADRAAAFDKTEEAFRAP
jgi:hypothetical protein